MPCAPPEPVLVAPPVPEARSLVDMILQPALQMPRSATSEMFRKSLVLIEEIASVDANGQSMLRGIVPSRRFLLRGALDGIL
jgi:hypothetical protein